MGYQVLGHKVYKYWVVDVRLTLPDALPKRRYLLEGLIMATPGSSIGY